MPFGKWSAEQVCEWLEEIGLGQYVIIARHWVASGQTLLSATPQDLERVYFCQTMLLLPLWPSSQCVPPVSSPLPSARRFAI